jgi:predicted enzyme related to lactoylglutathione lyase
MTVTARFGMVVESVPDIEAAKRFYTEVLGLKMERYHPTYIQFQNFAIGSDPTLSGEKSGRQELYWIVEDADAAYQELSQTEQVVLPLQQLPFGKVFGILDPAGQTVLLLEFARQRPSQAV